MSDIFISYAREDRRHAEMLAEALQAEKWSVWWDVTLRAGTTFDEVIERELSAARCVVVLWSSHSISSRWVRAEVEEAANRGILVPVLIEDVTPPLAFRQIHAINFSASGSGVASLSLQQLIGDVAAILGNPQRTPRGSRLRNAKLADMLEKGSIELIPFVVMVLAVLQAFSSVVVAILAATLAVVDGYVAWQRTGTSSWLLWCAAAGEAVIAAIAAVPGGYEAIVSNYKFVVVFVVARVGLASFTLRRHHLRAN